MRNTSLLILSICACLIPSLARAESEGILRFTPPLTRQSVDATAELLCFAAGQVAGTTYTPSAEIKSRLAVELAKSYSALTPEQQKQIAGMPLIWAALRVAWPTYSDADKQTYIAQWRQTDAIAKLASAIQQNAEAANTSVASANSDPKNAAKTMQDIQRQNMYYQTMSNCMRMQYQTSQAIIANMGGGYHYEYRWR